MLEKNIEIGNIQASDIMTQNPVTIDKNAYAIRALNIMQNKNITQLIVEEQGGVIGFIHLHDILKEGIV